MVRFAIGVFHVDGQLAGFVIESPNPFADRFMISEFTEFHESAVWSVSMGAINVLKGQIREMFRDYILKTIEVTVTYKVLEPKPE